MILLEEIGESGASFSDKLRHQLHPSIPVFDQLAELLWEKANSTKELRDVKRVSAEALGCLSPHIALKLWKDLVDCLDTHSEDSIRFINETQFDHVVLDNWVFGNFACAKVNCFCFVFF